MNPRNVTETAATCYLTASGWTRDLFSYDEERWLRNGLKLTRAKALLKAYDDDITRLTFVAQHSSLETLTMLEPAAVLEWLQASLPTWFEVEIPKLLEQHKEAVAKFVGDLVAAADGYNAERAAKAEPSKASPSQWPTPSDCKAASDYLAEPLTGNQNEPMARWMSMSMLAIAELQRQVEELQAETYRLRNGGM